MTATRTRTRTRALRTTPPGVVIRTLIRAATRSPRSDSPLSYETRSSLTDSEVKA